MSNKKKKSSQNPNQDAPAAAEVTSQSRKAQLLFAVAVVIGAVVAAGSWLKPESTVPHYTYQIKNKIAHDPGAYTQGLLVKDNYFYESTGLYGESSLRQLDLNSGAVLNKVDVGDQYFAEGLVFYKGVLIQLTWQEKKALIYNSDTLEQIRSLDYDTQGWGLATNGADLFMSDGSHRIFVRSASDFSLIRTLEVFDGNRKLTNLNELEYINGEIWANVYRTFKIARISPEDGRLLGMIDFHGILGKDRRGDEDSFNGIAWDQKNDRIFVTGKRYSYIYEVDVVERGE